MTELLKGKNPWKDFHWSQAQEQSFILLKSAFENGPILAHFNPMVMAHVFMDASGYAILAILTQRQPDSHQHPIAFYSWKMTNPECNYGAHD